MTKAIGILLLIAAAVTTVASVVVNHGTWYGIVLGLLLGTLLGPLRMAGVDFRQWFMDPGTPSELGDDSFIGLIKRGFHGLWLPWAGVIVILAVTVSRWVPEPCTCVDISPVLAALPDWVHLHGPGKWLVALVNACSGMRGAINVLIGTIVGAAVFSAVTEIVWRFGLGHGVPPPAPPLGYLAAQPLPRVRAKALHPGRRRLIVCCDGTWNWPDAQRETNVVRLLRALKPVDNGIAQIVHYHEGVGTGNLLDRIVGGGAGIGLSASVKACYGFLVDNYQEHDEIFLFGFSRGAYVMRSLAGFIGEIGMMRKHNMHRFAEVWNWYWRAKNKRKPEQLEQLAPDRCRHVDIECIGVWDTVGALGIPGSRLCAATFEFHETSLGPHVRHAFQALAIDERRGNFQGAVWVPFDPGRRLRGAPHEEAPQAAAPAHDGPPQVLEQAWFPGVHSNVGGGYPEHGVSDTPYLWMLSKLQGLLGLDQSCVVGSLDNKPAERYPGGKLEDSRTLFWKLIGSPVPRPVCIISATERVHVSAWDRSAAGPPGVAADDAYKSAGRKAWLAAIGLQAPRSPFEIATAALPRPPDPPAVNIPRTLGWCGRVLSYLDSES
jgi:hypothetical protein